MRVERREARGKSLKASGRRQPAVAHRGCARTLARKYQGADAPRSPASPVLNPQPSTLNPARGFTLTELLVVMAILAILTTMTVWGVNFSLAAERSRAAARQVQSYLAGARDRAIYERRQVGVRFLIDPNVANTASSMLYIEEIDAPIGQLTVSAGPTITRTSSEPTWTALQNKGLFGAGVKIRIPADATGFWYTIQSFSATSDTITVQPTLLAGNGTHDFKLKLPAVVRPNQEPMLLPRGIVVDLVRSRLPRFWQPNPPSGPFIERLDVMFAPRGTVTGRAATSGLIHFYLAEAADVERLSALSPPINVVPSDTPYGTNANDDVIGDRVLVTVFPQTGAISSHPINPTPSTTNSKIANDPFLYAELGEVAGE